MPTAANVSVMNPFWNTVTKAWFHDGTVSAGVTQGNSPAHPFAGSLGEQIIICDGNNASHTAKPYAVGLGATETLSGTNNTPDNTRRWGLRRAYLFRFTGTPSSAANIMQRSSTTGLFLNTDLTMTFTYFSGSTFTYGPSLSALAADTWYMLDCWGVQKDSAGNDLPRCQLVIRISTLSAGAQGTVTTLLNVIADTAPATANPLTPLGNGGGGASQAFGEANARGSGFSFYLGNVYEAWEDADDPYGVIRVDRLDPNAVSTKNTGWVTVAGAAAVSESGTHEPDDAANTYNTPSIDTVALVTTADQTYTLTNTVIATGSGDKIIRPLAAVRSTDTNTPEKGAYARIIALESDGTTNQLGANQTQGTASAWVSRYQGFDKAPDGSAWTTTNLNSLEMGVRGDTNSVAVQHYQLSTVTTLVAYQASGETMPAVPGAPPKPPSIFVRQGVNRASTY